MADSRISRNILLDEPSHEDLFHGQGHDRTAAALATAITDFKNADRSIGIDGPWGSGKSSVVGIAERKLKKMRGKGKVEFHFFTFDIWKSQGSAFRRSFLEHFVAWAKLEFPKNINELTDIDNKIKGKIREVNTNNQLILDWYGILILFLVPFIPFYVLWSKYTFDELGSPCKYLISWPMFLVYAFVALTLLVALIKYCSSSKGSNASSFVGSGKFRNALSRTLLIGAKQYEEQKITQYIRETDPNDFEFQSVLREILSTIQDSQNSVVMVLDNIDRLPQDEIGDYWALVRSIFSRTNSDDSNAGHNHITAIVPYDRRHIDSKAEINSRDTTESNKGFTFRAKEIFAKTFDEVLFVAPPVMSNTREFFLEKVAQALPDVRDDDALFRVYLVFNWMIECDGGRATPRQVIAYINELAGLFILHDGEIGLPTIAVYLAFQDKLENKPSELAKTDTIDDNLRSMAGDEELEKNLAAILFNVKPELAFQILLDGEIKSAVVRNTHDSLIEIANSPGFDVRLNEVFANNIKEWISGGRYRFVVNNICELLQNHRTPAAPHLVRAIVDAFHQLKSFNFERDASVYQKLIGICAPGTRTALIEHLLFAASAGLEQIDNLGLSKGKQFYQFLTSLSKIVEQLDAKESIHNSLKKVVFPPNPFFIFGFASESYLTPFDLTRITKPQLDLSADLNFVEHVVLKNSVESVSAFANLRSIGLVSDEILTEITTYLITSLTTESYDVENKLSNHLTLLSNVCALMPQPVFEELDFKNLFSTPPFLENLHLMYNDDVENPGLAHAIFLAARAHFGGSLTAPVRLAQNGAKLPAAQAEYSWLISLLEGSVVLGQSQYEVLASFVVKTHQFARWLEYGRYNRENKLVSSVVRAVFSGATSPKLLISEVFQSYDYAKEILGATFLTILPKLAAGMDEDSLREIEVGSYPANILLDTREFANEEWKSLHIQVEKHLDSESKGSWLEHFETCDQFAILLFDKAKSSGYKPESTEIKDAFQIFVLGVLDGSIKPDLETDRYDLVMETIDKGYRLDFIKRVREGIDGVNSDSVIFAYNLFPKLMSAIILEGEKSKQEKENLIRHLLLPSLEGGVTDVIDIFVKLERKVVADHIRACEKSTKETLEPALKLLRKHQDYEYVKKVTELIQGRKSNQLLSLLFPSLSDDSE